MDILTILCTNLKTGKEQTFIRPLPVIIGRKNPSKKFRLDIELSEEYKNISRMHATIEEKSGHLTLKDHSSNGTLVNDGKIQGVSTLLREGDHFTIQPYRFKVQYSVS